jgi:CoA:oxalate CoA-transferase
MGVGCVRGSTKQPERARNHEWEARVPGIALQGTTVLELAEGIAGPYCGKLLASCGAEVIKAEPAAGGDTARHAGPFPNDVPQAETSGLFLYLNTNKQGITLNLCSESGRNLLRQLVQQVDIVIESFAPGTLEGLGLGYHELEQLNPGLVMVSITPFGQNGPYSAYHGADIVSHAVGGWLYAGGSPDREPLKPGGSLAEYTTGLVAAVGSMTALLQRNQTGVGQHVDISSMEAMLSTTPFPTVRYSFTGQDGRRTGHGYPFTILPCKDGYVGVNILTQRQWEAMCHFLEMSELIDDPRFRTGAERQRPEAVQQITERIRPWLMAHSKDYIVLEGQKRRIPFSLVPTVADLLAFPQHRERGFFVELDHPVAGRTVQPGVPCRFGETPMQIDRPAPTLGQHNQHVYERRLGYRGEDIVLLDQAGVI